MCVSLRHSLPKGWTSQMVLAIILQTELAFFPFDREHLAYRD